MPATSTIAVTMQTIKAACFFPEKNFIQEKIQQISSTCVCFPLKLKIHDYSVKKREFSLHIFVCTYRIVVVVNVEKKIFFSFSYSTAAIHFFRKRFFIIVVCTFAFTMFKKNKYNIVLARRWRRSRQMRKKRDTKKIQHETQNHLRINFNFYMQLGWVGWKKV